jgi:mannose-6-phosphate isomerase-like protein (cupin superfamily)
MAMDSEGSKLGNGGSRVEMTQKDKANIERIVYENDIPSEPGICGTVQKAIDPNNSSTEELSFAFITINPKEASDRHHHGVREEIFYFISGEGILAIGAHQYTIKPGFTALIPPGKVHNIVNTSVCPLKLIAVGTPPYSPADTFKEEKV